VFADPPLGAGKAIYRERFLLKGKVRREKMGKWCAICESVDKCVIAEHATGGHVDAERAKAVQMEILFGKWAEERRVDVEKGREVEGMEFEWVGDMMEASGEREKWRASGKAIAERLAGAREEKIGKQVCDVCFLARKECVWPEVHFSRKEDWVAFCNEVCAGVFACVGKC
jgi:hypothetical protein